MAVGKHRVDKKVRYGKLKIYLLIFFLLSTLIFIILFRTNYFEINNIIVYNNNVLSDDEIISRSGVQIGENTFKIKISEIEAKIKKAPFIKDVNIKRNLPDKLLIEVTERKKMAAVLYMGLYFYIDEEGVILYTSNEIDETYVIEGFEFESFTEGEKIKVKNDEDLKRAVLLCGLLQSSNLQDKPEILYNEKNFTLLLKENLKVKLGSGENLSKKFSIFMAIYKDLADKNIDSGVVDISHDGYPTYSPFGE